MKAVQIVNPSEMKVVELEKPAVGVGEVRELHEHPARPARRLGGRLGERPRGPRQLHRRHDLEERQGHRSQADLQQGQAGGRQDHRRRRPELRGQER